MKKTSTKTSGTVVGMDLGDQYSHYYMLDCEGEEIEKGRVRTTTAGMSKRFSGMEKVKTPSTYGMSCASHIRWGCCIQHSRLTWDSK